MRPLSPFLILSLVACGADPVLLGIQTLHLSGAWSASPLDQTGIGGPGHVDPRLLLVSPEKEHIVGAQPAIEDRPALPLTPGLHLSPTNNVHDHIPGVGAPSRTRERHPFGRDPEIMVTLDNLALHA